MGLGTTAYRGLTKVDCVYNADGEPIDPVTRDLLDPDIWRVCQAEYFLGREGSLELGAAYNAKESMSGISMSYGSYGAWRERLAKLAGYAPVPYERVEGYAPSTVMSHQVGAFEHESGPFWELLCFSDCEGFLGPEVCRKLAADFDEWAERAAAVTNDRGYPGGSWFDNYEKMRAAFKFAADGGCVQYH